MQINMTIPEFATQIRSDALKMVHLANASHIGSCLSIADILAVLYGNVLKVDPKKPQWPQRDRLIVSKGHAAAAVYAALAGAGFFPRRLLNDFACEDAPLAGHVSQYKVPGVEVSTGSLGHGLPIACGFALAGKADNQDYKTYAILSDGELNEGSNWEAILFAAHHKLDNLIVLVDCNNLQGFGRTSEIIQMQSLTEKFHSFRWAVEEINGHDHQQIQDILEKSPLEKEKPTCVLAQTIKGKGVPFMEDQLQWHYRSPNEEKLQEALSALEQE